jgi:hypothetical protein
MSTKRKSQLRRKNLHLVFYPMFHRLLATPYFIPLSESEGEIHVRPLTDTHIYKRVYVRARARTHAARTNSIND